MNRPQHVVITGASGGIGAALALRYADAGVVLGLLARSEGALGDVANRCEQLGAKVRVASIDVRARAAMANWLAAFDRDHPVDLVVANAGLNAGAAAVFEVEPSDLSHEVMDVNVLGVLNTVHPLLNGMIRRRRGQLAIMSSLAGFAALPENPSYCASKAALLTYGLALRESLRAYGIAVNVICPGYVRTPMSQQLTGWKPFEMTAEEAAERILQGLANDKPLIAFPKLLAWLSRVGGILPESLRQATSRPFRSGLRGRQIGDSQP